MITIGKKNTLAAKRAAFAYITKEEVVKKLFDQIAPSFEDRNGGYTRVLKLGPRRGDGAEMAIIELVNFTPKDKKEKNKEKKEKEKKAAKDKKEDKKVEKPKAKTPKIAEAIEVEAVDAVEETVEAEAVEAEETTEE